MQWTEEKTGRWGTYREKRGRWHHIPYVVRVSSPWVRGRGMSAGAWAVVTLAALLVLVVTLLEELVR